MRELSPIKNIFRNKSRYIILFALFLMLISCIIVAFNISTAINIYINRMDEKYGGMMSIYVHPSGYDMKNAINRIEDNRYIKEIYYPGVETNSVSLNNKLKVSYFVGNETKEDEMEMKPLISYIGLDTDLIEYSGESFELIEGRIFENDNECVINKNDASRLVWSSINIGDKVILSGSGEDIELTVSGIIRDEIRSDGLTTQLLYTTTKTVNELATRYRGDYDGRVEINNPYMVNNISFLNGREYGYKCVVLLKDSSMVIPFKQHLETLDTPMLTAKPFYADAQAVVDTSKQTRFISILFLCIIVLIIIITTVITSIMYLSNRKYEFAVLCSVGMGKLRIMGSYITETLTFILITSLAAVIIGQLVFIFVLSGFFKSGFENLIETSLPIAGMLVSNGVAVIVGMSAVVVVTVLISMIFMLSFEPLKIFNKRYS